MNIIVFHLLYLVMKVSIWAIGKTDEKYLEEGINKYLKRLKHYTQLSYEEFKDVKAAQLPSDTLKREAEMIITRLKLDDILVLLDEKGQTYDSVQFAAYLEKMQVQSTKSIVFLIGGAFGHHEIIRSRANHLVSLSKMTFSHQMVRLFLIEQVYRAYTIIKNEKYHNI